MADAEIRWRKQDLTLTSATRPLNCPFRPAPSARTSSTSASSMPRPGSSPTIPASPRPAACKSKITYIDGDEGVLLYRGYPIEQLAEHGDFLETCYLLLYGELPTAAQHKPISTTHHPPHDGARADGPLLPGLPPRRASDGGDGRRGRRAVGLLSRLHRHQRSAPAR